MPAQTDPARELADLGARLRAAPNGHLSADKVLATTLGVERWSTEFYEIIHSIYARADFLAGVFDDLTMDEDHRDDLKNDLKKIKEAFVGSSLAGKWQSVCDNHLKAEHVRAMANVSPQVRTLYQYPKLSEAEADELIAAVDEFLGWLREHQLQDQDFIRQSMIEGLEAFRVRLLRLGWLGWGYTIQSLQPVLTAYVALERQEPWPAPDMEALHKKTTAFFSKAMGTITGAKTAVEGVGFVMKVYGVIAATTQGAPAVAKAALTFMGAS